MRVFDPFLVLIGHREAIERSAKTPCALLVGGVYVITAGMARNYDHLYFLAEWEWIFGPFAASLFSAAFIWGSCAFGLFLASTDDELAQKKRVRFLPFLAFFWLTAPCAWLYAIPVEEWGDMLFATKWNVVFLAVVSLWRVVIITRVIHVLTNARPLLSFLLILVPAALEVLVASMMKSMSLVAVMGGVRLPPHDRFLREATGMAAEVSGWIFLGGVLLTVFLLIRSRKGKREAMTVFPAWNRDKFCRRSLSLSLIVLTVWLAITWKTQIPVRNSSILERMLDREQFAEAAEFAATNGKDASSRLHYFPPRPSSRNYGRLHALLSNLPANAPQWLREEWAENFVLSLGTGYDWQLRFREKTNSGNNPGPILEVFKMPEVVEALRRNHDQLLESFPRENDSYHTFRKDLEDILVETF